MTHNIKKSTWILEENPLYIATCPHCGQTILMSREPFIKRLVKWAKMLKLTIN